MTFVVESVFSTYAMRAAGGQLTSGRSLGVYPTWPRFGGPEGASERGFRVSLKRSFCKSSRFLGPSSSHAGGGTEHRLLPGHGGPVSALHVGVTLTCLLVEGGVELVDRGRDLEPGLQDGLLPLETDVLGPLDEAGQVALGLDVLTDAEVARALLEQRVSHPLDLGLLHGQGRGRHLLPLLLSLEGKKFKAWAG